MTRRKLAEKLNLKLTYLTRLILNLNKTFYMCDECRINFNDFYFVNYNLPNMFVNKLPNGKICYSYASREIKNKFCFTCMKDLYPEIFKRGKVKKCQNTIQQSELNLK